MGWKKTAPAPAVVQAPEAAPRWDLAETGAFDGDPIVYVRDGGGSLLRCLARAHREYIFKIDGDGYHHVATHEDGTWIYQKVR